MLRLLNCVFSNPTTESLAPPYFHNQGARTNLEEEVFFSTASLLSFNHMSPVLMPIIALSRENPGQPGLTESHDKKRTQCLHREPQVVEIADDASKSEHSRIMAAKLNCGLPRIMF
jgi:hypothetical protein